MIENVDIEDIELDLLIEGLYRHFGYDFRNYSKAHLKRRLITRVKTESLQSISQLQHQLFHTEGYLEQLLLDFSINVTELFRDPSFFRLIRNEVIPILKQYSKIKIWHAGCSSGEEVYSMAIVLKEEGLYDRTQIYATDFNDDILKVAKTAIFPIGVMKNYARNYIEAGGKADFSDYFITNGKSIILNSNLQENIVFAHHNLVSDGDFAEMHLIICRNVLIYFDKTLQNRVFTLFDKSLIDCGILCLGSQETLKYSSIYDKYKTIDDKMSIYQHTYSSKR